ncbi:hypothetical protein [Mesorhizobium sp.]|uniref:hypothetical protein n=1 Tax=Mesorhizobium sp. TaxID=1871066 RepID=UPI000FE6ED96|nr:hypothetical protein [Mesorhizobium sp.]RWE95752.1 MAG: hypothetical protein EOS68_18860 [Mesorhizobium sp.]
MSFVIKNFLNRETEALRNRQAPSELLQLLARLPEKQWSQLREYEEPMQWHRPALLLDLNQ